MQFLSYKEWLDKREAEIEAEIEAKYKAEWEERKAKWEAERAEELLKHQNNFFSNFVSMLFRPNEYPEPYSFKSTKSTKSTNSTNSSQDLVDPFGRKILNGTQLMYYEELDEKLSAVSGNSSYFVNIAGLKIPIRLLNNHLFLMGQSGSGKTLLLSLLLNSIAQRFKDNDRVRALVHDFGDTLYLPLKNAGLNPLLFNPFIEKAARWDISEDCCNEYDARQLSAGIVGNSSNLSETPFYDAAIRHTIAAILAYLAKEHGRGGWGFRDICKVALDADLLKQALNATDTGELAKGYFSGSSDMAGSARAALRQTVYEILGATEAMENQSEKFSVRGWSESWGTTLVLSYPLNRYESMKVISGMFMQAVAEQILSKKALDQTQQEKGDCQTYLFLDEVQVLPKLPSLPNLLNLSRKFGGSVILATQSRFLLDSIYGRDVTESMINNCQTQLYCRCMGEDAVWASGMFGSVYVKRETLTMSSSKSYTSSSISDSKTTSDTTTHTEILTWEPNVRPDQLMNSPCIPTHNSIGGFGINPYGSFIFNLESDYLYEQGLAANSSSSDDNSEDATSHPAT